MMNRFDNTLNHLQSWPMGGGSCPEVGMVKTSSGVLLVNGVASNDKRANCWCGTGKVGVAPII